MVGIFAGSGFGFERGSASVLGGSGLMGSAVQGWGGEGIFVNAGTGNLVVQKQDEFLVGKGPDIAIARTYNSLTTLGDDNNDKWRQSTDRRVYGLTGTLNTAGSTVSRVSGDGTEIVYAWDAGLSAYVAKDGGGAYDRIVRSGSEWVWTDGDTQTVERYEITGIGRIKSATNRNGSSLTFAYDGSGRLTTVTSADGSWVRYDYVGSTQNISQVVTGYTDLATSTAKTLTRTRYAYDGSNRLTTVTVDLTPGDNSVSDGATYVTTYSYDGAGRLSNVAQSDGSNLAVTYDGSGRVATLAQTESTGVTRTTSLAYGSLYTTITDPAGQATRMDYDAAGNLTRITAPPAYAGAAQQIVQFAYNANGDLVSTTDALGHTTTFSNFTADGLAQTVTDRLGNAITRTYSAANLLLSETRSGIDASGSAALATTRYVYDAKGNLRFAISAEGRVTEYTRGSAGEVTYETVYAEAAYTTAGTSSEANMTSWVGGLADKSWVQKTKYLYDARGAVTSVTSYGIANSSGTEQTGEGTSVTSFVYDQAGQLLSSYAGANTATTYLYDGMGRVTATNDANGGTTTFAYNAGALTTTVTLASGYVTTKTYNKAGDLVSVTDSGADTAGGTTGYAYDKLGRVRVRTDANGLKTYVLYDDAGRHVGDVDGAGHLTEYRYDANNRLVGTIDYRNAVSGGTLSALATPTTSVAMASIRPGADTQDVSSWVVYDAEGRVVQTILGDGSTTISTYDAAGRLQKTTAYVNKIAQATVDGFVAAPPTAVIAPTARAGDAVARRFYDKDGLLIGTLSGEGYLTRNVYDSAGQLVATTAYATQTSAGLRASGSFTALLGSAATSAPDRTSHLVYDGQGLLRYAVDALNQVVRYDYDAAGNRVRTAAYAAPLGTTSDYTYDAVKSLATSLEASSAKRVAYGVYDAAGRLAYAIDAAGAVIGYAYDSSGRVTKTVAYAALDAVSSLPDLATMNGWVAAHASDAGNRVTRTWYTARGEAAYVVDAEGYVSLNVYDAAGQVTAVKAWDHAISVGDATTFAQVTAAIGGDTYAASTFEYGSLGRLTAEVDGEGARTTYAYLGMTGLKAQTIHAANGTGAEQAVTSTTYDHAGRAVSTVAAQGTAEAATGTAAFDGRGELISTADPRAKTTSYTYDLDGRVRTVTDAAGGVTSYEYNAFGEVWKTTDPNGNVSYAWYDKLGRTTMSRDAAGYLTTTGYTAFGEVASVTRWMTAITGTPAMGTEPTGSGTGATTAFTYDARGQVLTTTDALNKTESYTYDAFGNRITATNKLNSTTTYSYDRLGRLVRQGVAAATSNYSAGGGSSLKIAVNATGSGQPVSLATDDNHWIPVTAGTRLSIQVGVEVMGSLGDAQLSVHYHDDNGNYISGETVNIIYGNQGPNTKISGFVTVPANATLIRLEVYSHTTGAGAGSLVLTEPMIAIASANDTSVPKFTLSPSINLISNAQYSSAADWLIGYNPNGIITSAILAGNSSGSENATVYSYDSSGNLKTKVEGYSTSVGGTVTALRTTTYTYDRLGQATQVAHDAVTVIADDMVTVSTATPTETYAYDKRGNVIKSVDAGGAATYAYYDHLDRQVAEIRQLASNTWVYTAYAYDANGNLVDTKVYEGNGYSGTPPLGGTPPAPPSGAYRETVFTYDNLNRLLTSSVVGAADAIVSGSWNGSAYGTNAGAGASAQALTTTYLYDADGNVVKTTDPNGAITWSWYDSLGRKIAQLDGEQYLTKWSYDAEGNVIRETRYATRYTGSPGLGTVPSVATDAADRITDFEYDLAGNRTREIRRNVAAWSVNASTGALSAAGTTDSVIEYTYNALGQVTAKTIAGVETARYNYDSTGRLTWEGRGKYYDANGELVEPITSYTYDSLGDLVNIIQHGWGGTYNVDDRNTFNRYGEGGRLLATCNAEMNVTYFYYDAAGRLKKQAYDRLVNVDNTLSSSATTTVAEAQGTTYDLAGRALTRSVYSTVGGTLTRIDFASFEYNAFDQVTRQGTGSNASGAMWQAENRYDAAGRLIATNAGAGTDGGVWKVFAYDRNGNQTGTIVSAGAAFSSSTTFASAFAAVGNADVNGTWTLYDGRGQAIQVIEEGRDLSSTGTGQTLNTYRSYNAFGEIAAETNALGNTVTYTYNTMGRKLRAESPAVEITDETGAVYWVKPSEDYYYDLGGRLVATRDASEGAGGANYAKTGSNAAGATSKAANTGNLTTYAILGSTGYDGSQSLIATEFHADGGKKQILYDRLGDVRVIRDELYNASISTNLHQEERTYNKLGQLIEVKHNRTTDISNDSTRLIDTYKYDQFGQRIQHGNNQVVSPIYGEPVWVNSGYYDGYYGWIDTSHWENPIVGYDSSLEKTTYDALGRVTTQTDLAGQAITTTYTWDGALITSIGGNAVNLGGWAETTGYSGTTRTSTTKTDIYTREVYKSDLGSVVTTSTYDAAGRLSLRTIGTSYGSIGNTAYSWYNTGLVQSVVSTSGNLTTSDWMQKSSYYYYDAVGNRLGELLFNGGSYTVVDFSDPYNYMNTYTVAFGDVWINQSATYDALGRLLTISADSSNPGITYKYDAAGNIRRSIATRYALDAGGNATGSLITDDYWFGYDSMNRLVVDKGALSGTYVVRGAGGQDIAYDALGQRASVARTDYAAGYYDPYVGYSPGSYHESREIYNYDGASRLLEIRESQGVWTSETGYTGTPPAAASGATDGTQLSLFTYDLMGRQLTQNDYAGGTSAVYSRSAIYNASGQVTSETVSTAKYDATYRTDTTYTYTSSTGEYFLGAVASASAANYKNGAYQTTSSTTYAYAWRDGPLQSNIQYKPNPSATVQYTGLNYDATGALMSAQITDGRPRTVTFRTNAEGQVIQRYEAAQSSSKWYGAYAPGYDMGYAGNTPHEYWYRFAGVEWGYSGNNGTTKVGAAASIADRRVTQGSGAFRNGSTVASSYADFAQSYDPLNSYSQGSAAGSYTVQRTGESLRSIASALWGDSSLWYKLAEANGLAAETNLVEGQRLTIPAGVIRNTHNANTFRPYNAAETIGD